MTDVESAHASEPTVKVSKVKSIVLRRP